MLPYALRVWIHGGIPPKSDGCGLDLFFVGGQATQEHHADESRAGAVVSAGENLRFIDFFGGQTQRDR